MRSQTIDIGPLRSNDECYAAAAFQREIWAALHRHRSGDATASSTTSAGCRRGVRCAGTMLGFVFGVTERVGRIVHWSHMLGVSESARNLDPGDGPRNSSATRSARLGEAHLLTFDPLMAKNAFQPQSSRRRIVECWICMTTTSPLHFASQPTVCRSLTTTPNDYRRRRRRGVARFAPRFRG
jgi:hypothetical protein